MSAANNESAGSSVAQNTGVKSQILSPKSSPNKASPSTSMHNMRSVTSPSQNGSQQQQQDTLPFSSHTLKSSVQAKSKTSPGSGVPTGSFSVALNDYPPSLPPHLLRRLSCKDTTSVGKVRALATEKYCRI